MSRNEMILTQHVRRAQHEWRSAQEQVNAGSDLAGRYADSSGKTRGFLLSRTERTIAWARRPHSQEPVMAVRMRRLIVSKMSLKGSREKQEPD